VDISTEATSTAKAYIKIILCFKILLGGFVEQSVLVAQRLLIRIFAEEPVDQFHTGTDLSTPPSLEGRHDGVQLPLEVTLGELRDEVEGSAI